MPGNNGIQGTRMPTTPAAKRPAAIYARYSSDLQRDRSIDDQVALCRRFAESGGYEVVRVFCDRARSGASVFGRDGLMTMMDAAREKTFDVLIVEALDRLSRDQEDLAGLYKRLQFAGVEIIAVHDGRADQIQVGIRALVGTLYLQDLAHKVRRGMEGVVRDGRHPGGRAYGYRPVPGRLGELEIVEEEAAIVRRIYESYAAGATPRDIATALNREDVPPPRGDYWRAATINGNSKRGNGILQNELYAGQIVWNKVRMVKDPDTGKRVSRPNPPGEWQRGADAPELAIIDPALWQTVQQMKRQRALGTQAPRKQGGHLLTGLLKCGECGSGMSIKDRRKGRRRVMCSQAKEAGACTHRKPHDLERIITAVVSGLKDRLTDREAIAIYIAEYNAERERLAGDAVRRHNRLESEIARLTARIARAKDLYIDGLVDKAKTYATIDELATKRTALEAELQTAPERPKIISLHPKAIDKYLHHVERLQTALLTESGANNPESFRLVRELIESVTVHADSTDIEVRGRLSALIGGKAFPTMRAPVGGYAMVAEEGLEPPTRGL